MSELRVSDLSISVEHRAGRTVIRCAGELDVATCRDLQKAIRKAILAKPAALELDCTGISLLTAAGIKCLVEAEVACRSRGIDLDMELSPEARKVLDLVGLWWLGVVKDGISAEVALEEALRAYGNKELEGDPEERPTP
ncbi:MAG TPA: STAS domain-containing protein [Actinomycetota bacterium]|nr:STAS domain-containing protein [Actinomycetota bacterium]